MTGAMSFGKAWQDFEKFARETEVKKGLQITTLSPADVAKMKELAKPIIAKAIDEQEERASGARILRGLYEITRLAGAPRHLRGTRNFLETHELRPYPGGAA